MKTAKTAPAEPQATLKEAITQIASIAEKLSPEQREQLRRLGVDVPAADMTKAAAGEHVLGLRCSKCNDIALYFIGTTFRDVNGVMHDEPQPGMQTHEVAWTQDMPSEKIDRRRPQCQNCHARVPLEGDGSFRVRDRGTFSRLVKVKEWRGSRDLANNRAHIREQLRGKDKVPAGIQVSDEKPWKEDMSATLARIGKDGQTSEGEPAPQIPPNVVEQIDYVGKKLGY